MKESALADIEQRFRSIVGVKRCGESGETEGIRVNSLFPNDEVSILQKVAPQFDVAITVLQKEGEEYTHHFIDPQTQKEDLSTNTVPEGSSYLSIHAKKHGLGDFWKAVNAEKASQQNLKNPPKI